MEKLEYRNTQSSLSIISILIENIQLYSTYLYIS